MKEKANEYLEENLGVKKVFATTDGFLFLQEKDAQNHAQTLKNQQIQVFEREAYNEGNTKQEEEKGNLKEGFSMELLKTSVKIIRHKVKRIGSIEWLEALILEEESRYNRTEVLQALSLRIEELKNKNNGTT